tara:strand:- start:193 stop:468 length:276 start_codon:yes stop_codon:yes gene_type:complete
MSYHEQAEKINKNLKDIFKSDIEGDHAMSKEDIKKLIDNIIWFGQVAKYRCRSNTAYDNFSKAVFEGIVELERTKLEGQEFEVLRVKDVVK